MISLKKILNWWLAYSLREWINKKYARTQGSKDAGTSMEQYLRAYIMTDKHSAVGQEMLAGYDLVLWNLKAYLQQHTSSNKAVPFLKMLYLPIISKYLNQLGTKHSIYEHMRGILIKTTTWYNFTFCVIQMKGILCNHINLFFLSTIKDPVWNTRPKGNSSTISPRAPKLLGDLSLLPGNYTL